jgi:hypothetical protein
VTTLREDNSRCKLSYNIRERSRVVVDWAERCLRKREGELRRQRIFVFSGGAWSGAFPN